MHVDGENDNIIHSDTECMRDVPIGNDDFMSIRDDDGYYVDKTKLIEDILGSRNTKVFLFTRPRRFGKTLNLSML
ncbi:MAG: AAA family ATPase, partial [Candidatus Methanomethylophilaceae archaeon]|nr:AAA family ATPase [Candidatus Methanomethylophilaceae archaeon]